MPGVAAAENNSVAAELYAKHRRSAQPESRHICVVLDAVREVLSNEQLEATPTAIFADVMSSLDREDTQASAEVSVLYPLRLAYVADSLQSFCRGAPPSALCLPPSWNACPRQRCARSSGMASQLLCSILQRHLEKVFTPPDLLLQWMMASSAHLKALLLSETAVVITAGRHAVLLHAGSCSEGLASVPEPCSCSSESLRVANHLLAAEFAAPFLRRRPAKSPQGSSERPHLRSGSFSIRTFSQRCQRAHPQGCDLVTLYQPGGRHFAMTVLKGAKLIPPSRMRCDMR